MRAIRERTTKWNRGGENWIRKPCFLNLHRNGSKKHQRKFQKLVLTYDEPKRIGDEEGPFAKNDLIANEIRRRMDKDKFLSTFGWMDEDIYLTKREAAERNISLWFLQKCNTMP